MPIRHTVLFLALLLVGFAMPTLAQQARTITFNEAIQLALRQNVPLQQSANNLRGQSAAVTQRRMNFLPSFSLSASRTQGTGRTLDPGNNIINQSNTSYTSGVNTSVNVFNGFGDIASLQQARANFEALDHSYERNRQTVVFNVINQYLGLISAVERVRIREEDLEAQRQQLSRIEEFVNVGSRSVADLYQQQALTAQAESQLLTAQRDVQLQETRLIQLLQLDPFGTYQFVIPSLETAPLETEAFDLGVLLRSAYDSRSDLRAQESRIDAASQGRRAARSGYWPSLDLRAGYSTSYSPTNDVFNFSDQLDLNRGGSFTFSLSVPIFSRFSTWNSVQQADVNYSNARLTLEDQRQTVALEVRQAYLDYLNAEKQLEVTAKQEQAASQALQVAQERYNVGASTLVELQQARATFIEAASNQIQAKYSFIFQKKLIDYYVGGLNPSAPLFE